MLNFKNVQAQWPYIYLDEKDKLLEMACTTGAKMKFKCTGLNTIADYVKCEDINARSLLFTNEEKYGAFKV